MLGTAHCPRYYRRISIHLRQRTTSSTQLVLPHRGLEPHSHWSCVWTSNAAVEAHITTARASATTYHSFRSFVKEFTKQNNKENRPTRCAAGMEPHHMVRTKCTARQRQIHAQKKKLFMENCSNKSFLFSARPFINEETNGMSLNSGLLLYLSRDSNSLSECGPSFSPTDQEVLPLDPRTKKPLLALFFKNQQPLIFIVINTYP